MSEVNQMFWDHFAGLYTLFVKRNDGAITPYELLWLTIRLILLKDVYAAVYKSEIERRFTPREAVLIWDKARSGYQKILADHSDLPPKVAAHADRVIFPAVAIYRALRESCLEQAMEIMEQDMAQRAAKVGKT